MQRTNKSRENFKKLINFVLKLSYLCDQISELVAFTHCFACTKIAVLKNVCATWDKKLFTEIHLEKGFTFANSMKLHGLLELYAYYKVSLCVFFSFDRTKHSAFISLWISFALHPWCLEIFSIVNIALLQNGPRCSVPLLLLIVFLVKQQKSQKMLLGTILLVGPSVVLLSSLSEHYCYHRSMTLAYKP